MTDSGDRHNAFAKDGVKLAFGLDPQERIRHIREVAGGSACNCICPACGERLVAHQGEIVEWHFKHKTNEECATARETAIHFLGKEILEKHKRLVLPPVVAKVGGRMTSLHGETDMEFDEATLERRLEGVIPDIILRKDDRDLVVEILVTHRVDAEKVAKLKAMRLPGVEIDLSRLPRDASRDEIEKAVISHSPRIWLWNAKIEAGEEQIREQIATEKLEIEKELDQQALAFLQQYDAVLAGRFFDHEEIQPTIDRVAALGFGVETALPCKGERIFKVRRKAWQSILFDQLVIRKRPFQSIHGDFADIDALVLLEKWIPKLLVKDPDTSIRSRILALRPDFATPWDAVGNYFDQLIARGLLDGKDHGCYTVNEILRKQIKTRQEELVNIDSRRQYLDSVVTDIVSKTDKDTRSRFDFIAWARAKHAPLKSAPVEIIQAGNAEWNELLSALSAISRAFWRDQKPEILLDLPVLPAIQAAAEGRAAERARQRLAAEAREEEARDLRGNRLVEAARYALGEVGDAWLDASIGQVSRREAARNSDAELERLLRAVTAEVRRRQDEDTRRQDSDKAIAEFREAARRAVGPDLAEMLLNNVHPEIKARPIDLLKRNARNLERCLSVIKGAEGRSKR